MKLDRLVKSLIVAMGASGCVSLGGERATGEFLYDSTIMQRQVFYTIRDINNNKKADFEDIKVVEFDTNNDNRGDMIANYHIFEYTDAKDQPQVVKISHFPFRVFKDLDYDGVFDKVYFSFDKSGYATQEAKIDSLRVTTDAPASLYRVRK